MSDTTLPPALKRISARSCSSSQLQKRIQTHADLALFHSSPAYTLITAFIVHLNSFVSPLDPITGKLNAPQDYATSSPSVIISLEVEGIVKLISILSDLVASAPPDPGPRRFGHVAFRKWLTLAQQHIGQTERLGEYLPPTVLPAKEEILHYLINSFGSGERLDYGTGHELSFAAFLCCIWVLGGFHPGRDERALVVRAFDAYFKLVRKLVVTYSLEPAGSHGVWGLDDHAFLPYIFGSAQLTTFRPTSDMQAGEADAKAEEAGVPRPADVTKPDVVNRERTQNLYFDAIGFIHDVKKGPFWEHSPILYDISGVQKGWGKINEGMLKMYDKEVLSKFPVVQHFSFGSIFRWSAIDTSQPGALTPRASDRNPVRGGGSTDVDEAGATFATSSITASKPGPESITTRAPWAPTQQPAHPASAGIPTSRPIPTAQLHTVAPWASAPRQPDSPPKASTITETPSQKHSATAAVGRRSSILMPSPPVPALAPALPGPDNDHLASKRTGGVHVAETGDLSGRRVSTTSGHPPTPPHRRSPIQQAADTIAPWAQPPQRRGSTIGETSSELNAAAARRRSSISLAAPPELRDPFREEDHREDIVRTEAQLGPRRTNSPDSARASVEEARRGNQGTGGVRVAETGDLSGRRASRDT